MDPLFGICVSQEKVPSKQNINYWILVSLTHFLLGIHSAYVSSRYEARIIIWTPEEQGDLADKEGIA
jgi:hypothetical protein